MTQADTHTSTRRAFLSTADGKTQSWHHFLVENVAAAIPQSV